MAWALGSAGWQVTPALGRGDDLARAAEHVDVLVIATRDSDVAGVAASVTPVAGTTVVHLAGSLTLEVLASHPRRASVHPLVALPDPRRGSELLRSGVWFGVAAVDAPSLEVATSIVESLGGRQVAVAEDRRPLYHAAATIASNHLVALMGQVARLAAEAEVPLAAYSDLARTTLENIESAGPEAALTGPVARGDWATVRSHRRALPADELPTYDRLAAEAARLAGRDLPPPDQLT